VTAVNHKARILIVDDSTVIRRLLSSALATDPAMEVAGTAANGRIALQKIPQLNPDIVTLDIEMPDMDGLATLAELRKTYPRLPVIMFSTMTQRGAVATLNALALGASDYVTKPANVGGVTAAMQAVRDELIPKVKALCKLTPLAPPRTTHHSPLTCSPTCHSRPGFRQARFGCIAIGVSTGGPNALTEIFRRLPADLPVPIVVVQHMPPVFTKYLAQRLDSVSPLAVREAQEGDLLKPGTVRLAPGNFHMQIHDTALGPTIHLNQEPPENSCRPAVDVLYRSVAQVFGPASLAFVLTGMGRDGLLGCEAIVEAKGRVVVQDEATSVVWGMPGAVAEAGLADLVTPLPNIAAEIVSLAWQRRIAPLKTLATSATA
jgi:two-component system, chemotaxis family, protein-glutamate methylesterase/glutaminase